MTGDPCNSATNPTPAPGRIGTVRIVLFVMLCLGLSGAALGVILATAWGNMPAIMGVLIGPFVLIEILGIMFGTFHLLWRPMLKPYPWVEPTEDAVRRNFQSISIDMVNLGLSVHIIADENHLHLVPASFIRVFGASPASIPWSALRPHGRHGRAVKLGSHVIRGPRWCMELADPSVDQVEA